MPESPSVPDLADRLDTTRRQTLHTPTSLGERITDSVVALVGSWRFIIWSNVGVFLWILFNVIAVLGLHWDPYPFILLNLVFSWQAYNTGPLVTMSQNRQAAKDRARDDHEAEEVSILYDINKQQLEILQQQNIILDLLRTDLQQRIPASTKRATGSKDTPQ